MANTINLVTKFQPLLDEVYKAAALTGDLENSAVKFDGTKTVKEIEDSAFANCSFSFSKKEKIL